MSKPTKSTHYEIRSPGDGDVDYFVQPCDDGVFDFDPTNEEEAREAAEFLGGTLVKVETTQTVLGEFEGEE